MERIFILHRGRRNPHFRWHTRISVPPEGQFSCAGLFPSRTQTAFRSTLLRRKKSCSQRPQSSRTLFGRRGRANCLRSGGRFASQISFRFQPASVRCERAYQRLLAARRRLCICTPARLSGSAAAGRRSRKKVIPRPGTAPFVRLA